MATPKLRNGVVENKARIRANQGRNVAPAAPKKGKGAKTKEMLMEAGKNAAVLGATAIVAKKAVDPVIGTANKGMSALSREVEKFHKSNGGGKAALSNVDQVNINKAQAAYQKAQKAGDKAGMAAAHKPAEAVRAKRGFTGGASGKGETMLPKKNKNGGNTRGR